MVLSRLLCERLKPPTSSLLGLIRLLLQTWQIKYHWLNIHHEPNAGKCTHVTYCRIQICLRQHEKSCTYAAMDSAGPLNVSRNWEGPLRAFSLTQKPAFVTIEISKEDSLSTIKVKTLEVAFHFRWWHRPISWRSELSRERFSLGLMALYALVVGKTG